MREQFGNIYPRLYLLILLLGFCRGHPVIGYVEPSEDGKFNTSLIVMGIVGMVLIFLGFTALCFGFFNLVMLSLVNTTDQDIRRDEENKVYLEFSSEEQELYFQAREYLESNPYFRGDISTSQRLLVEEKGVNAWEFVKDPMLANNDMMVLNRNEITFFKNLECSTQTNLPLPTDNEVYYFESKIYHFPDPGNTLIAVGLGIKPYPWFRLPGRHMYSISYDSDGNRRHNQPFKLDTDPLFPSFVEGDVIGIGYRVRSGTVFFTRNGKKLSELRLGGHIKYFAPPDKGQLYPIIGANNLCSVHVNVGQRGFVFIEGNVKKWGFGPLEGNGPAPPAYNKYSADIILERSDVGDENDLSERESDFPPSFWDSRPNDTMNNDKFSYDAYEEENAQDERITLDSIPASPPSYNEDYTSK